MSEDKKITRRSLLTGGLIAGAAYVATPVERLMNSLSMGFIHQAQAEASGNLGARNYVNVLLPGGPLRYVFDHFLRTKSSDAPLLYNHSVTNRYLNSGGKVSGLMYSTFNFNGVEVPHMFSQSVNGASGARPLTALLNNMLVIRGFGSGVEGHPFNASIQQAPVGGLSSVMGLAADYSLKTFEAVEFPARGAYGSFNSSKNKAINVINGSEPLKTLMKGFGLPRPESMSARNLKDRNADAFELAQSRLRAYANSDFAGAQLVNSNMSNAVKAMKKGIADVDSFMAEAVARYKSIVTTSMRQSNLPGISDYPIISEQTSIWNFHLRSINAPMILSNGYDARALISTMEPPDDFCEGLALAEYLLTRENLGTAVNITMGDYKNLLFLGVGQSAASLQYAPLDMHFMGAYASVLIGTAYFRGLSAGLLELIDKLKASRIGDGDLWSETVIQILSEFNRPGRYDGTGSDHGINQMVTSAFSGAIQNGPHVVGNVLQKGLPDIGLPGDGSQVFIYPGSQGVAAPIDGYNQSGMPTPAMAASTMAALLRVPHNPYENVAAPLVELSSGGLRTLYPGKFKV